MQPKEKILVAKWIKSPVIAFLPSVNIRESLNEQGTRFEFATEMVLGLERRDRLAKAMASSTKESELEPQNSFILTEDDIPGAKINRETIDQCSVVQLKRWLLCRGAKTSGKKSTLVTRVKDYIKNGLDRKYLRDPDGGINVLRKKAESGMLEHEAEPEFAETFPKEGFKSDLMGIPKVSFSTVWRYMIDRVDSKKKLSTAKPLVKGYNFFKSGHVLFVCHLQENGKHYIKSQVLPSMKKTAVYSCHLVLSSIGNMLRGYCGCPAGIDGRCNHIAATLFALEEYCKERVNLENNPDESCTSKPCKWNIPRKRKGSVVPVAKMTFAKHDYAKKHKLKRLSKADPAHDVRAHDDRNWSEEKKRNMFSLLKKYEKDSRKLTGWTHILPQEVPKEFELISPVKSHPVSPLELRDRCERIKKKILLNDEEIQHVEKSTRGQSSQSQWHYQRKCRITASKCYRIAVLRDSTSPTKAMQEVLGYNNPYQSASRLDMRSM